MVYPAYSCPGGSKTKPQMDSSIDLVHLIPHLPDCIMQLLGFLFENTCMMRWKVPQKYESHPEIWTFFFSFLTDPFCVIYMSNSKTIQHVMMHVEKKYFIINNCKNLKQYKDGGEGGRGL